MGKEVFSFWEKSLWFEHIDLAVIGSGIVGLSTAINYKRTHPNHKVVIIEAHDHPYGASTKNAGFACFGSLGEILDDLESLDEESVLDLIEMRWQGLELLKETVPKHEMEYLSLGAHEVFTSDDKAVFDQYEDHMDKVNKMIQSRIGLESTFSVSDKNHGFAAHKHTFYNQYEGQLNPAKMIKGLIKVASNLDIQFLWSHSVTAYYQQANGVRIQLNEVHELNSKKMAICTNAFVHQITELEDVIPYRNQVLLTTPIDGLNFEACFHMDQGYIYFRNYENRVLIGGARNRDMEKEATDQLGSNQKIIDILKSHLSEIILPNIPFDIAYHWSGIIATGTTKKAIVRQIDQDVIVAVRMGGMGVAIGSKIGHKAAKLLDAL